MCNGVPEGKACYESCEPRESEKRASTNGLRSTNFLPFFSSFSIPLNIKRKKRKKKEKTLELYITFYVTIFLT